MLKRRLLLDNDEPGRELTPPRESSWCINGWINFLEKKIPCENDEASCPNFSTDHLLYTTLRTNLFTIIHWIKRLGEFCIVQNPIAKILKVESKNSNIQLKIKFWLFRLSNRAKSEISRKFFGVNRKIFSAFNGTWFIGGAIYLNGRVCKIESR